MLKVKWIKIVTDIFDDEKMLLIESMPEANSLIVIWLILIWTLRKSMVNPLTKVVLYFNQNCIYKCN